MALTFSSLNKGARVARALAWIGLVVAIASGVAELLA